MTNAAQQMNRTDLCSGFLCSFIQNWPDLCQPGQQQQRQCSGGSEGGAKEGLPQEEHPPQEEDGGGERRVDGGDGLLGKLTSSSQ